MRTPANARIPDEEVAIPDEATPRYQMERTPDTTSAISSSYTNCVVPSQSNSTIRYRLLVLQRCIDLGFHQSCRFRALQLLPSLSIKYP
jgi:hypothetical protein